MPELIDAIKQLGTPTLLDWAPLVLSVIAVFVAIYVPSRIAKRQNKIAAFDKLYAAYSQFLLIKALEETVRDYHFTNSIIELGQLQNHFCSDFSASFGYWPDLTNQKESAEKAVAALRNCEVQASMIPLLIPLSKEKMGYCAKELLAIFEQLYLITGYFLSLNPSNYEEAARHVKLFSDETEAFHKSYSDIIETMLKL